MAIVASEALAEMKEHSGNVDSVIFSGTPDGSNLLGTTTCWIAAEHALRHARNNKSLVSELFGRWKIQESEHVILAGFDESLIKSGVGFLEQIHVFVIADVNATSPLLSELGRLFSPFSSILFTKSTSCYLPVFKDDGSVWEFDELVYFTASKFGDGESSAKNPLTIIGLAHTPSFSDGTGMTASGSSQSSSVIYRIFANHLRSSARNSAFQKRSIEDKQDLTTLIVYRYCDLAAS